MSREINASAIISHFARGVSENVSVGENPTAPTRAKAIPTRLAGPHGPDDISEAKREAKRGAALGTLALRRTLKRTAYLKSVRRQN